MASDASDSSTSEHSEDLHCDDVLDKSGHSVITSNGPAKRKRTGMSARERNLRRLESNERERLRMHSLNAAFEVDCKQILNLNILITDTTTKSRKL